MGPICSCEELWFLVVLDTASPLLPSCTSAAVILSIVSLKSSTTSACNAHTYLPFLACLPCSHHISSKKELPIQSHKKTWIRTKFMKIQGRMEREMENCSNVVFWSAYDAWASDCSALGREGGNAIYIDWTDLCYNACYTTFHHAVQQWATFWWILVSPLQCTVESVITC